MKDASRRFAILIISSIIVQGMTPHLTTYAQRRRTRQVQQAATLALPAGKVGQSYEYQLQTEGGMPPYTWQVQGTGLPPGLRLEVTGKLKGTPTVPGREPFSFVIAVEDSSEPPQAVAQTFTLMIQAAPLRIVAAPPPLKIKAPEKIEQPSSAEAAATLEESAESKAAVRKSTAPRARRVALPPTTRPRSSTFANMEIPASEPATTAEATGSATAPGTPAPQTGATTPAATSGQDTGKDQKLIVDKAVIEDDSITGKTEAKAKVEVYAKDLNNPEASSTAKDDGSFKVNLHNKLVKGQRFFVQVIHTDGKKERSDLIDVADAPDAPALDAIKVGDKQIKGSKARNGADIKIFRNKGKDATPADAEQSGKADDKGAFAIPLANDKPVAKGNAFRVTQTVNTDKTSPLSDPATEAISAESDDPVIDKVSVGDTRITGKASKGGKIDFFRNDVNEPEKSGTANTQDGAFIILLSKQIAKDDRIWIRQTSSDGKTVGKLIAVDIAAPELEAPIIDNFICWTQVVAGTEKAHIRVEGRTTPGKKVQLFFDDSSTPVERPASNDGVFFYENEYEKNKVAKSVQAQLKDGDKLSKLSPLSECTDPNRPFLVGLAPFGLVASQQSEQFSQADPFGGFIVGNVWPLGKVNKWGRKTQSFNLRFQVLMQPEARTASAPTQAATASAITPKAEMMPMTTFLSSRKSLDIEGHMWWEYALNPIVSLGPYFALGGATTLNKNELVGEDVSVGQGAGRQKLETTQNLITTNDMKKYYEYGMVLDFFSGRQADGNLYIQAILAKGWYEALANLDQHGHDTRNRFIGKLRVFPFGLNRNFLAHGTVTPLFGVDLNAGRGQDFPRFFVGMVFNITKFLNKANEALPKP